MAKKVLWISDRPMTDQQEVNLQWLYGAEGEVQLNVFEFYPCNPPTWSNIRDKGKDCDIFAFNSFIANECSLPLDEILHYNGKTLIVNSNDDWMEIVSTKL